MGGLFVGVVFNDRLEFFVVVIVVVFFVDVVMMMFDESVLLMIGEYDEWGDL